MKQLHEKRKNFFLLLLRAYSSSKSREKTSRLKMHGRLKKKSWVVMVMVVIVSGIKERYSGVQGRKNVPDVQTGVLCCHQRFSLLRAR
jgi:hypothetical protein